MSLVSHSVPSKGPTTGLLLKRLFHKQETRGMTLIQFQSRCVRRNEIHELVSTDQVEAQAGDRINRVGFIGFVEIVQPGVIEVGDAFSVNGRYVGSVLGFDECHFPNHYNILIACSELLSSSDLEECVIGGNIEFTEVL